MAKTANEEIRDAATRHQIDLRRYTQGEIKTFIGRIEKHDRELASLLRRRLNSPRTEKRIISLFDEIQKNRRVVWQEFRDSFRQELYELAKVSSETELAILESAIPWDSDLAKLNYNQVRAAITKRPFQGRHLREWFATLEKNEQARLRQTLTTGIIEGRTTDDIVRSVIGTKANKFTDGILSASRREATTVIRTATNHVANRMREDVWAENADIISALVWSSTLDGRTSPVCRARDGHFAQNPGGPPLKDIHQPTLEPQGARPPAHMNCLLGDSLVSPIGGVSGASKRFYKGEVVTITVSGNHEITGTPNHPVLTDRGWLPLKALEKGSRVVSYIGSDFPFSGVENKDVNGKTSIEEVADSFFKSRGEKLVTTSGRDFHGDGVEGEVCVVGANGFLETVEDHPAFIHLGIKQRLKCGSGIHYALAGQRSFAQFFKRCLSPFYGFMRFSSLLFPLFRRSFIPYFLCRFATPVPNFGTLPSGTSGFGLIPDTDPAFMEFTGDDDPAELPISAELSNALSGNIALNNVIDVRRRYFSGHVFNLQTSSEAYLASPANIVTHNCRSYMIPYFDDIGLVGSRTGFASTKTNKELRKEWTATAKEKAGDSWGMMDRKQRNAAIMQTRNEWAKTHVGDVPASMNYNQWLRTQPAKFQDEVLGKTKGKLYRDGKVDLDKFVDRSGNELTIDQLRARIPGAFNKAGI